MTPISIPVAKQPSMDLYADTDEKTRVFHDSHDHLHDHDDTETLQWSARPNAAGHKHCHNGRLKRFLIPALVAIVALSGLFAVLCFLGESVGDPSEMLEGLFQVKRAVDGGDSTGSTGSTFTKHKLYLIVVFVGLFVVLVLGVMLSAWCCKGAFENPCCCPCYLCACCGGLACLECIGCGLCAEGVDQM
ncbi:hypothetical protein B0H16DRAFT_1527762 [Mycena metata]|uniref:Transmembrane protein n=1 Tax=Mycena metata TaxID=1033252 RepID=A0AAD7NIF2_9AGAR|nr:hypothetical protein B0H16DRAFT_1536389 [Mycena metata]KAJ7763402.1 hypothetical protein B0H16DRAFT_1527762 [Mycena metata]